NAVLLAVLFVEPVLAVAENNPGRNPSSIAGQLLGSLGQDLRLPRRDAGCLRGICGAQPRFTVPEGSKRFRTAGFIAGPYVDEAFDLFALRAVANGDDLGVVERWRALADGTPHARHDDDVDDESDGEAQLDAD